MSNSVAVAVLVTADLGKAIRSVRALLAVADVADGEVDFEATIRTPEVLSRVQEVLPGLEWWAVEGKEHGCSEAGDDPAVCLPVMVFDWGRPMDRAEPFIAAAAGTAAAVRWDLNAWPEVPEADLEAVSQKYAYLTLTLNSRDLYQREPSRDHTIHVHTDGTDGSARRVEWLAGQIGGRPTGRVEPAPI
ncbi:hypothetical protein ACFWVP_12780 [Streptomyces sp. NPDC058637]|uniref:hypothetical protein n=1 Tax=Streptomyces sp. NPDC058637 TaxID=3346569 RepID=UPI0036656E03